MFLHDEMLNYVLMELKSEQVF